MRSCLAAAAWAGVAAALLTSDAPAQGMSPMTLDIGGFAGNLPDPTSDPANPGRFGYMAVTAPAGTWTTPVFHVVLRGSASDQDRSNFMASWPFLFDQPVWTLEGHYAEHFPPGTFAGMPPLEVSPYAFDVAVAAVTNPPDPDLVTWYWQPVVPLLDGDLSDATRYWSADPPVWQQFSYNITADEWRPLNYRGAGAPEGSFADEAIQFDAVLQWTFKREAAEKNVAYFHVRNFMNEPRVEYGNRTAYDYALDRWGFELKVQYVGLRGLLDPQDPADAAKVKSDEVTTVGLDDIGPGVLPTITISPADLVVFQYSDPLAPGQDEWGPIHASTPGPFAATTSGKLRIPLTFVLGQNVAKWQDNAGTQFETGLDWIKPGLYEMTIPPQASQGPAHILTFLYPNASGPPPQVPQIPFYNP